MQPLIHPQVNQIEVRCSCGNVITTTSTRSSYSVEVCNQCHPFYTGQAREVDSAGAIAKFRARYGERDAKKA